MEIENELKELIIKKSGSVNRFAQECELPVSTVATIFTRGVNKTNINTIIKICHHLNISVDELAQGRIAPVGSSSVFLTSENARIDIEQLNELNKERLIAYYEALRDSQNEQS